MLIRAILEAKRGMTKLGGKPAVVHAPPEVLNALAFEIEAELKAPFLYPEGGYRGFKYLGLEFRPTEAS